MSAVVDLGDRIAKLTLAQAVELKTLLKTRYGIEPATGIVFSTPKPDFSPVATLKDDPAEFNVILEGVDPAKKLNVIRLVRELTGQGLAEAKATVESGPRAFKEGLDRKTADDLKKKLEEAGARVTVRPA